MSKWEFSTPFRTYASTQPSLYVARDLESHYSPYVVIRRDVADQKFLWYVREVNEEFLLVLKLGGQKDILNVLGLHEYQAERNVIQSDGPILNFLQQGTTGRVVVDSRNNARFLSVEKKVVRSSNRFSPEGNLLPSPPENVLYAQFLLPQVYEVDQDDLMEFCLEVTNTPSFGASMPLSVDFPEGAATIDLYAQVSSQDFAPPKGEAWNHKYTVDRQLTCGFSQWVFKGRSIGDKQRYSLSVAFHSCGNPVGRLVISLGRRGASFAERDTQQVAKPLRLPNQRGARLHLELSEPGSPNAYKIMLYQDGVIWNEDPIVWSDVQSDTFFHHLNKAESEQELRELGNGLFAKVPKLVREFFDRQDVSGLSTLITSGKWIAPFEILPSGLAERGMLGINRPLARWNPNADVPRDTVLSVKRVACIRPRVGNAQEEVHFSGEETDLQLRFGKRLSTIVRTKNDLENLLNKAGIEIVHFAGHADADHITLEDDRQVPPGRFGLHRSLFREHPLFFLNGCRSGYDKSSRPFSLGGFPDNLLVYGCSGVVAPGIEVKTEAARQAAATFYKALVEDSKTVPEAVQEIHALARHAEEKYRASYLSYIAFTPPNLTLNFE